MRLRNLRISKSIGQAAGPLEILTVDGPPIFIMTTAATKDIVRLAL